MAQIFHPRSNTVARVSLFVVPLLVVFAGWTWGMIYWSPYTTRVNTPLDQPVPFSHRHHAAQLGIDCRYCHVSVEKSEFAGVPDTATCMTCHSQLFVDVPMLKPVRQSLATGTPLRWNRANKLPDFVFFNHSIHIAKGIGCTDCHGPMDEMTLTWKGNTLYMKWCLDCHREPEGHLRPTNEVFNLGWRPSANQHDLGRALLTAYHVNTNSLEDCSMCHR
jgi:Cytochrome c7 and related cytochrome c/Class III cytochrome C family